MSPDRVLALSHFKADVRPGVEAIFRLDATLAEITATASQPEVGLIRLAWWREAIERLATQPAPPEPRLAALADHVIGKGVDPALLSDIEDGYAAIFEPDTNRARIGKAGGAMFEAIARLIGGRDDRLADAGALAMLARVRGLVDGGTKEAALVHMAALRGHRFAPPLRPLTMLARLAVRDFLRRDIEAEATPGRAFAMLSHRLSGRVTSR